LAADDIERNGTAAIVNDVYYALLRERSDWEWGTVPQTESLETVRDASVE
jgi:hypothetical protein